MKKYYSCIISALLLLGMPLAAQNRHKTYIPETDPLALQRLAHWQDLKFGLFMHWGFYSQWGVVESWSLCSEDEEWCRRHIENYEDYKRAYNDLQRSFDPVRFDPHRWAAAAKAAGMKYMVFTTKHHDGFCMFDTKYTDFKITAPNSPFSRSPRANITKEVFEAFRREHFMIGAYFSKPDWHSDFYWWERFATPDRNVNYNITRYPERWEQFVRFTQGQIDELMSDYGKVDILWLDGGWVRPQTPEEIEEAKRNGRQRQNQDIRMHEIAANARAKQPGIIMVDREVPGPYQNYLTPENQVPNESLPYPWETCMPMGDSWSYVPADNYKTTRQLVHLLADIVSKGGNLLLNVGPGPDGEWDETPYQRLKETGQWMDINGEAIYATRAHTVFRDGNVVFTKKKDSRTVYAIYLAKEGETQIPAQIAFSGAIPAKGAGLTLLGYNGTLRWSKSADGRITVQIPKAAQKPGVPGDAWVVKISEAE